MVDLVRRQEFEIRGFPISHLKEPLILPLFGKKKSVSIRQQAILFQHFHRGWNDPLPLSKVIRRLETECHSGVGCDVRQIDHDFSAFIGRSAHGNGIIGGGITIHGVAHQGILSEVGPTIPIAIQITPRNPKSAFPEMVGWEKVRLYPSIVRGHSHINPIATWIPTSNAPAGNASQSPLLIRTFDEQRAPTISRTRVYATFQVACGKLFGVERESDGFRRRGIGNNGNRCLLEGFWHGPVPLGSVCQPPTENRGGSIPRNGRSFGDQRSRGFAFNGPGQ